MQNEECIANQPEQDGDITLYNQILTRLWLAYLFSSMDFRLGPVNLLPNFVAYLLLLDVLASMQTVKLEVSRLRGFVWLMFGCSILSPVLSLLTGSGIVMDSWIPLAIITTMVSLYLWYILFTELGRFLAAQNLSPDRLYRIRNCNVLLTMIMFFTLQYLVQNGWLTICLTIAQIVLIVWFLREAMRLSDALEAQ